MASRHSSRLIQDDKFPNVDYFCRLFLRRTIATPTSTIKIDSIMKNVPSSLTVPFGRIRRIANKKSRYITTNITTQKYLFTVKVGKGFEPL